MSKCSVGIDLVYMPRYLDKLSNRTFLEKILTENELNIFDELASQRRKLEFLCGRFACKEAYSKALKVGIGKISFKDIEILRDEDNVPLVNLKNVEVSISHDGDYATAIVIVGDKDEII